MKLMANFVNTGSADRISGIQSRVTLMTATIRRFATLVVLLLAVAIVRAGDEPLTRVQIAHCGDTDDVSYIEGLLAKGVYVGLDRYGLEIFLPIDKRNATAAELLRRGHAERLMISQDFCATIDWFPPEAEEVLLSQGLVRNWSMTLVFDEVVPALREQGALDDSSFQTVFVENPRRWLSGS